MSENNTETFRCYVCERVFRWNDEISGKTIECKCGANVRCPELHSDTMTAGESLEDTVADVVLEEIFDDIEPSHESLQSSEIDDLEAIHLSKVKRHHGIFGLPLGGEVFFFSITSLIGVAFTVLCVVTLIWEKENARRFWPYAVAAALIGPISWKLLANRWRIYSRGRSVPQVVADLFSDELSEG